MPKPKQSQVPVSKKFHTFFMLFKHIPRPSNLVVKLGKWGLLITLIYLTAENADFQAIKKNLLVFPETLLAISAILFFTSFALYSLRWFIICKTILPKNNISTSQLLHINFLALFVNIFIPSALSVDGTRTLKLSAIAKNLYRVTSTVIIDRYFGLITMVFFAGASLPFIGVFLRESDLGQTENLLSIVLFSAPPLLILALWLFKRLFSEHYKKATCDLKPFHWGLLILLSLLGHLIMATCHIVLIQDIHPIPILTAFAIVFISQLARVIPLSILGISLGEVSIVTLLTEVGLSLEEGFAVVSIILAYRFFFGCCGFIWELVVDGLVFFKIIQIKPFPQGAES